MLDPFKSFETIIENYKRYVKTAFRTRFESFEGERESLLNKDGTLYGKPWVEPLPQYNYNDILNFEEGRLANNALQRGHETRQSAIRALILYPMNALVEDQMTRLRKALDSNEARQFFDGNDWNDTSINKWKHNRLYF